MAAHSSTLAWKIPWTEEHGRLQSMGLQRVRHDFIFLDPPKFCILMDANLSFFFSFLSCDIGVITKKALLKIFLYVFF